MAASNRWHSPEELTNSRPSRTSVQVCSRPVIRWHFPFFDQIAGMHKNPDKSPGRELAAGLHSLGFGTFVQDAWKWQHEALCEDFVRNFDAEKMTTVAFGTAVDLSFHTFVGLTGLPSDDAGEIYPEEEPCLSDFAVSWRKYFGNDAYDPCYKGFALGKCKDGNLKLLIETLNDTAWMRRLPRKSRYAPKDLVYLMCQVEKNKRVNWGRTIHNKFVNELTRLYMISFSNKKEKLTTRAGPLMCFLFAPFMDHVGHRIEGSSEGLRLPEPGDGLSDPLRSGESLSQGKEIHMHGNKCDHPEHEMLRESSELFIEVPVAGDKCEHLENPKDEMFRKSSELFVEVPLAGEKWDNEKESGSSELFVEVSVAGHKCEHLANTADEMFRQSSELFVEVPLAGEKWDDEKESASSWEEVLVSTEAEPSGIGFIVPQSGRKPQFVGRKKRPLFTEVDEVVKLVEMNSREEGSRFAKLYVEEQKHAEECLKAKLAAEKSAESLRAELKEVIKVQQQKTTTASMEEQFAKQQLIVLRQRLEKSILERDQARAENKYLKIQLKKFTAQLSNRNRRCTLHAAGPSPSCLNE